MEDFRTITEVVLFNECGCELDRKELTEDTSYDEIIRGWIIYPGDRIEIVERETEV